MGKTRKTPAKRVPKPKARVTLPDGTVLGPRKGRPKPTRVLGKDDLVTLLGDQWWRLNNLYWIQDAHGRKVRFTPNAVQKKLYYDMWWLNVVPKSRQHGISTFVNILQLDQCLFNANQTAGIIDRTDADGIKKMAKIRFAYENLDCQDDGYWVWKLGALIKKPGEGITLVRANDHEMEFSNGSKIWAATSHRGGTIQILHISELGPIAYHNPLKAEEIRTGALNTVHKGSKIIIESTHEGGKAGLNYEMIELARNAPTPLTALDWKVHFFGWHEDPKNVLELPPNGSLYLTSDQTDYFADLEAKGICLTPEQKHWYIKKQATQKEGMLKEFPSTIDEALNAVVKGAIYGRIIQTLRDQRRITNFEHDRNAPKWTFWDLGQSDFSSIWLVQFTGREFNILKFHSARGKDARYYADVILGLERQYGLITGHYLPHDAAHRVGPGLTWTDALQGCGMRNINVVPRTADVWIGINHLRSLLPRCWIHYDGCSTEWEDEGIVIPSGVACLENYRTKEHEQGAVIKESPVHDEYSHGCDALRTFAEAHLRGLLDGHSAIEREARGPAKVIMGRYGETRPLHNRVRVMR